MAPVMVLRNIVKNAVYTISVTLDNSPRPNQIMNRVTNAIGGMNLKNSTYGSSSIRTSRKRPDRIPNGTATVHPIAQPVRMRK